MSSPRIARHRTALNRQEVSRPIRLALETQLLTPEADLLDYGCGRGDDVKRLRRRGIRCVGWDPVHRPRGTRRPADVVNLGYVVNVIEDPSERAETLLAAWGYCRTLLIVSARLTDEAKGVVGKEYADGLLTRLGTFQKYYKQSELREWIDRTLGVASVAAAPGVFYVFRDQGVMQSYLASRYRRRAAAPRLRKSDVLFEQHKDLLEPLMAFVAARGRLPEERELETAPRIAEALGSVRRAFTIVRRVTGEEQWDQIREERSQDLLVYLALARFGRRPRLSDLPRDLQLDVRAFFSRYSRACADADQLLFSAGHVDAVDAACRAAPVGKIMPDALYVHVTALPHLPAILRVYEGCARNYIGAVEGANVVKLHRGVPQVSYLAYPEFERDPHPALIGALLVNFQTRKTQYRDYAESENPPILHRKEEFLPPEHPLREKFARLTRQEERWGLYEKPEQIGTRAGWQRTLADRGVSLRGHRLVRTRKGKK